MGNCKKCGGQPSVAGPTFSVRSNARSIDGKTAQVQFRRTMYFEHNGRELHFAVSQVTRISYADILAALAIHKDALLFINPAEKHDFEKKHKS